MGEAPSIRLGTITIWLPTASDSACSIFEDLADRFGLETNQDALDGLRAVWSEEGHRGKLDLDCESDAVAISAGKGAIVTVAALIDRLSIPERRQGVTDDEVARLRAIVKAHKPPRALPWEVGAVFAIPLVDGSFAFGQIVWEQPFAPGSGVRAPTCILFEHRAGESGQEIEEVVTSRTLAMLNVSSEHLDAGKWVVIGRIAPMFDPVAKGPKGWNTESWDGLETLAAAWHGLAPWNAYYRDDYLDRKLLSGVTRPVGVVLLRDDELILRGVVR